MSRTYVITGAASGIGKATAQLIRERGGRVIGVDVRDTEVIADLSTTSGRATLADQVAELTGGKIDAVIANAGVSGSTAATVAVNYFGAVATLAGLRPLLARSDAPRAVATVSGMLIMETDGPLLAAMRDDDEPAALSRAAELLVDPDSQLVYASSKLAMARWIRREAPSSYWAGQSITLNGVAPGFVDTPMSKAYLALKGSRETVARSTPLGGLSSAADLATPIAWLSSEENSRITGQVLFVDGGFEVDQRGESIWDVPVRGF